MKKLLFSLLALAFLGTVPGCKKKDEPKKEKKPVKTMIDVDWQAEEEDQKADDNSKF